MKPKNKRYQVNIDMTWSADFYVSAKTKTEAKQKAWEKFVKTLKKKNFQIEAETDFVSPRNF